MARNGCVIVIGGNEDKRGAHESILGVFIRRAGGDAARVVIIPSASAAPEKRAARYTRIFKRLGAAEIAVVHAERPVTDTDREAIRNATGIFVTGGNQSTLMNALRSNDLVELIRESVAAGAVYAGTSAGAAAVSELMIAGSSRKKGLEHVEYGEGLGLIPDVIIDQHFGERRRLTRLMTATRAQQLTGVGIDENTALVWNRDGLMTVEGAGEVTIIDTDQRAVDDGARSLRLTILRSGARWVAD